MTAQDDRMTQADLLRALQALYGARALPVEPEPPAEPEPKEPQQ